jgi:hypothetical protein
MAGYSASRPVIFAEAAFYTAILYDFVVVPGALMVLVTGPLMIWLAGGRCNRYRNRCRAGADVRGAAPC